MANTTDLYNEVYKGILRIEGNPYLLAAIFQFYNRNKNNEKVCKLVAFETIGLTIDSPKKRMLYNEQAHIIATFLSDPTLLRCFYDQQTATDQRLFYKLTWEGVANYQSVKEIYRDDLFQFNSNTFRSVNLNPKYAHLHPYLLMDFSFIAIPSDASLSELLAARKACFYFPEFMRLPFREALEKPADSQLRAIDIPTHWTIYQFEAAIFRELPLIISSLQQRAIKKNIKGRLNIPSLKATQKRLALNSFPNDGGVIKAMMLANFVTLPDEDKVPVITPAFLKQMFLETQKVKSGMLEALVFPYTGLRTFNQYSYYPAANQQLRELVMALPMKGWITLENLQRYAECKYLDLNVLDLGQARSLQPNFQGPSATAFKAGAWPERERQIRRQMVTSIFLLAASLGFVDLAYDPDNKALYGKHPKDLTEGLFSACRLTALGAHVLLGKQNYKLPDTAAETAYELDPANLTLKVSGNVELVSDRLREWTSLASKNHLKLDPDKILRNCPNKEALLNSIEKFRQTLEIPMPDQWKEQLMALVYKSTVVVPLDRACVYKLSPYDKQLHHLVAHDEVLSAITLKGEQFTLIVQSADTLTFLNRMAALGYVLEIPNLTELKTMEFLKPTKNGAELCARFEETFQ